MPTEYIDEDVTSHSVPLTGLTPDTQYRYRVRSTDPSNNTSAFSDWATFTTASGISSPPASGTWDLVWNDEFEGTSLDTQKWSFKSFSQAYATDSGSGNEGGNGQLEWNQPANCSVADSVLTIEARRETVTPNAYTYNWTSGLITSTGPNGDGGGDAATFQYGYIEERVRLPGHSSGMWPAFWTWQAPGVGVQTECDVYEWWPSWSGHEQDFSCGTHGSGMGGSSFTWIPMPGSPMPDTGSASAAPLGPWMVFGADITADGIDYYHDGVLVNSIANTPTTNMCLIVNLAVWQDVPPPASLDTATLEVDYVRLWQRT